MPEAEPPDWRRFASERLPHAPADVQIELAQHLEQAFADALASGQTEGEARAWAESRFADWRALSRDIANSKPNARPFAGMAGDLRRALPRQQVGLQGPALRVDPRLADFMGPVHTRVALDHALARVR